MSETETVKLFNPNDGVTGRDNGTYLDLEEARAREERSAKLEKRKPDYSTVQATGIPLKFENEIRDRNYVPEHKLIEGKVAEAVDKHFEDGANAEVKIQEHEFTTSTAEEEEKFLKQGEENRLNQGQESDKTESKTANTNQKK